MLIEKIGERGVIQDVRGRVPHIQENLIQGAMIGIPQDEASQLIRVAQRRQRAINQPDDLADSDLGRWTAELIAALGATHAFNQAGISEFNQD